MMTITRQQVGKLRNSGSIPVIDKGVLFNVRRPDWIYGTHNLFSRGTGRSFCCSKTAGS